MTTLKTIRSRAGATIAATLLALSLSAFAVDAKNFAIPPKNPAMTMNIPDNWKVEEIEYGFSAVSPGRDVFFSVEYVTANKIDTLMEANKKWMKEQKIKMVEPKQIEAPINGIPSTIFTFDTTDDSGPTTLDFIMMPGGDKRLVLLTLWGSTAERKKHGAAIDAMMSSIKPIN